MHLKRQSGARRALPLAALAALGVALGSASPAGAIVTNATFAGSNTEGGKFRSAEAQFSVSGDNLFITLINTAPGDVMEPDQLLSSIYFRSSDGTVNLTKAGGGVFLDGSKVYRNGADVTGTAYGNGGSVGGEFGFRNNLTGGFFGGNSYYGIGANGMDGFFGAGDLFAGPNLDGPGSPNGMNYGIMSAGDNPLTYNGGIANEPIIFNSVKIQLKGASNLDLASILDVQFQYGTSNSGPRLTTTTLTSVPEPGAVAFGIVMGGGLLGMVARGRRRKTAT